jgi:Ca2+-binding EF-hand superfamily protein
MLENLTEEEKADLRKAFNLYDKNQDGKISLDELKEALNASNETRSNDEINELVLFIFLDYFYS